jgi:PUA domain protein
MFRKFDPDNDVSTSTQVKASVQRALKSQILEANPGMTEEMLDELLPKKPPLVQYKVGPHMMLYCRHEESSEETGKSGSDFPTFFQHRDGPILPTLKLVHQYPSLKMTAVTVDKGAIPFLLGGANIMCPGLTNPGSHMPEDTEEGPGVDKGAGIVIFAEGKDHAIAVGVMTMSSKEM